MKRNVGFQAKIMSINYASNILKDRVLDEIIGIEKRINYDSTQTEEVSNSLLLRYAFLFRLKSSLNKLLLNEELYLDYHAKQYSKQSAILEAEIIYNKYFSKRLKMSYKDYITKRCEKWYSPKDLDF